MDGTMTKGYGAVARAFHWLTAILIVAVFLLGWYMSDLEPTDPDTFRLYQIHKSIGITILGLALLRLIWRVVQGAPDWPEHMAAWERLAAAAAHWALYGLILAQPIIGILHSNAANFPIVFWDSYEVPALMGPNEMIAGVLESAHELVADGMAVLILLHVAAALRHHLQLKDNVLRNMMPSPGVAGGVAVVALALLVPPFLLITTSAPENVRRDSETSAVTAVAPASEDDTAPVVSEKPADAWIVGEASELGFVALQQGAEVRGRFDRFNAVIVFDPDDLENSRIDVNIDVVSINTGQDSRDDTLKSASFFETATWPTAAFKSGTITASGDGRYVAAGTLTIRDVTKDVILPFTLAIEERQGESNTMVAEAKGDLPILRLDYGVGQGDWASTGTVADEVVITIDIKASKAGEAS
ncbi:MAG: YceI family protein [Pseudomonadota bacterium]